MSVQLRDAKVRCFYCRGSGVMSKTPEADVWTEEDALEVVDRVARRNGLERGDLMMPAGTPGARAQRRADARGEAMLLIRAEMRWGYERIGRLFAGRDHSTVIHAIQLAAARTSGADPG